MTIEIKALAEAIATGNAKRPSFRGKVFNAQGHHVSWVHFMGGLCKSLSPAVSLCSDDVKGADLMHHFKQILGSEMPVGGKILISPKRKPKKD